MSSPTADVSVRVAWDADAPAIARVQSAAWRERYADLAGAPAVPPDEVLAEAWAASLRRPPDARHRVLVGLERARVVGFVLTGPSPDPDADPVADGEMADLTVAPGDLGAGHGSRLLQAAVDTLRADRFTRATTWVLTEDDALRAFLTGAGWAADGAARALAADQDEHQVRQVRLHTAIG